MIRTGVALSAALLFLAGALPAAATSPSVILGFVDGTTGLNTDGVYHTITVLDNIPAGTWWVTATAVLSATTAVSPTGDTTCRIRTGTDTTEDEATFDLLGGSSGGAQESLLLTTRHGEGTGWNASFDCKSNSTGEVDISNIRISAVNGLISGSGSPRLAFSGSDGSVNLPANAFQTVRTMSLGAGKWWILAKADLANNSSTSANNVTCKLTLSSTDKDKTAQSFNATTEQGHESEAVVEVGHVFSSAGTVALKCGNGSQAATASHPRLAAIKAGKLTRKAFGGSSSTSGSGTPVVITGYRSSSVAINTTDTIVGSLALPAGKWLVSAKAWLHDGSNAQVFCNLLLDTAEGDENLPSYGGPAGGNTGLYLQGAVDSATGLSAQLDCEASTTGTSFTYVRITAISASSLLIAQLAT